MTDSGCFDLEPDGDIAAEEACFYGSAGLPYWLRLINTFSQIILSSSDSDYLDQLIPLLKNAQTQTQVQPLIQALNQVSSEREAEIERICNTNHQEITCI